MLKLTKEEQRSFARALTYLPSEVVSGEDFVPTVAAEISNLEAFADMDVCILRKKRLNQKFDASVFMERVIVKNNSQILIAGLRYRHLDPNFPFIEVNANFSLSEEVLIPLYEKILTPFKPADPKGIAFLERPGLSISAWKHTLFGSTHVMPTPELPLKGVFESNMKFYPKYYEEYMAFHTAHPDLTHVRVETEEDFKTSLDAKLLYQIYENKDWVGMIAGEKSHYYGLKAIYIRELLLNEKWRGKGLGTDMQKQFLYEVSDRFDYVWGTIHATNYSSLNTALNVGRKVIQTEYFIEV